MLNLDPGFLIGDHLSCAMVVRQKQFKVVVSPIFKKYKITTEHQKECGVQYYAKDLNLISLYFASKMGNAWND